jgi:hypothetical protein
VSWRGPAFDGEATAVLLAVGKEERRLRKTESTARNHNGALTARYSFCLFAALWSGVGRVPELL